MRIRTRWFNKSRARAPEDLAGVASLLLWRVARQALARMRSAGFEIETGAPYFNFLAEWLVFLIQAADRYAFKHFSASERYEFTATLAKKLSGILIDNLDELVGVGDEAPDHWKKRFVDLVNRRGGDYAEYSFENGKPEYGFLRPLAHTLADQSANDGDRLWVYDQVMEVEAPRALEDVKKGVGGLFAARPVDPDSTAERSAECGEAAVDPVLDDARHHRLKDEGKLESMLHD